MMGLMVLIFFAFYISISVALTWGVVIWAKANNSKPWLLGGLVAFVMYNLVFWDLIPTLIVHKHYCDTQAGFWVYKTPEQWKVENPGVMETLVANEGAPSVRQGDMLNYTDTYFVNQRINWVIKQNNIIPLLPIIKREQLTVDTKNNKILARQIDFGSHDRMWGGLKFWMDIQHCSDGKDYINNFGNFANQFKGTEK